MLLSRSRVRAILIRDVATRESTRGMIFAADMVALLYLPFVFPLNYLRALRDWPTNPVRASIIYQSYAVLCVLYAAFRINRIVYSGERHPTLFSGANPLRVSGDGKRRGEETEEEATGKLAKGAIAHDLHELTRNSAEHREFMTRLRKNAVSSPVLRNTRNRKYCQHED